MVTHRNLAVRSSLTAIGAIALLTSAALPAAQEKDAKPPEPKPKSEDAKPQEAKPAELGKPAPGFELKTIDGKTVKLDDYKGKTVVIEWFNPACPFCVFAYGENGPLKTMPEDLTARGVVWLSIVSENPANPGGKVENIKKFVDEHKMKAPMLLDPDGKIGKLYGAKSTPHVFVISVKGLLVYRGALDNGPFGNFPNDEARVNYVTAALTDLTGGHAVTKSDSKPYG